MKRGFLQESPDARCGEQELVKSLKEESQFKFLGVLETGGQPRIGECCESVPSENVCDMVESTIGLVQGSCKQPVCATGTCVLYVDAGVAHCRVAKTRQRIAENHS